MDSSARQASHSAPPPLPAEFRQDSDDADRRLAIGAAVGAGLVVLFLLILLLVSLALRGCEPAGSGSGGSGDDRATGSGGGDGGGHGSGSGSGAGPARDRSGTPKSGTSPSPTPGALPSGAGQASGENPAPQPPPPQTVTVRPLQTVPSAAPGDATEEFGGGGGDSDGSEFFGTEAKGRDFVYVVDCSGSMSGAPFQKACEELTGTIGELKRNQKFFIFFFDDVPYPQFYPDEQANLVPASPKNKDLVRRWVGTMQGGGGTQPRDALLRALELEPDAIFFLTDGGFDPSVADEVRNRNREKIPIHTIAFVNNVGQPLLEKIANENRGTYRFVP